MVQAPRTHAGFGARQRACWADGALSTGTFTAIACVPFLDLTAISGSCRLHEIGCHHQLTIVLVKAMIRELRLNLQPVGWSSTAICQPLIIASCPGRQVGHATMVRFQAVGEMRQLTGYFSISTTASHS